MGMRKRRPTMGSNTYRTREHIGNDADPVLPLSTEHHACVYREPYHRFGIPGTFQSSSTEGHELARVLMAMADVYAFLELAVRSSVATLFSYERSYDGRYVCAKRVRWKREALGICRKSEAAF